MLPKIAIIHPDTLAAIGLKHMLQEVMPMVEIDTYRSATEVPAAEVAAYIHYFAATSAVADNVRFFTDNRRKTIILSPSSDARHSFPGFHSLCTSLPEKQLVKSLLLLEQTAHAGGRNLPTIPQTAQERKLSVREVEVMSLVVKGLINKEIADRLNIGLATVVTHRRNIMEKLGIKSVSALTIYAVTHEYVSIDEI